MADSGGTKTITIITICIMLVSIGLSGCLRESPDPLYHYKGMSSEILLSSITTEDFENITKKDKLINELTKSFPNVSSEMDDIYIWYNNEKYLTYNKLSSNQVLKHQYSKIIFLLNLSIIIESEVDRTPDYMDTYYNSKEKAEKEAKDLIDEDIAFLKNNTYRIVNILHSIYSTAIINETYAPFVPEG